MPVNLQTAKKWPLPAISRYLPVWALADSNLRPQPCEGLVQVFNCPACGVEIEVELGES